MALTWDDIVDVEVDITLTYNAGQGAQQAESIKSGLTDWGADWKLEFDGADYRADACDMAENLACEVISAIWDEVADLTLTKVVNFQGDVTLTYIKGTQKTKKNSIVPELAHLSNEMIAGNYDAAAIMGPVQRVVRRWVAAACDECVTDAGG